jgi:hypothetical protein
MYASPTRAHEYNQDMLQLIYILQMVEVNP